MNDPFAASAPWDTNAPAPQPAHHQAQQPVPATNFAPAAVPAPAPSALPAEYRVGATLKAADRDGEWITPSVTATTPEAAAQGAAALLRALHEHGVIATVAQAAQATRDAHLGGTTPAAPAAAAPRFENGRVTPTAPTAGSSEHQGDVTCVHGAREHRAGTNANGPWEAMFCPLKQCQPAWKDKQSGRFVAR
ncbi:hypothetical protein ACH427_03320 [Streptomyces sp. NPDC020379]|uniref:hypothetical protein n=1 Tax=Streptomyces sp. NPDC020379 TaxID=3365071 RepID=UPI0037B2AEC8